MGFGVCAGVVIGCTVVGWLDGGLMVGFEEGGVGSRLGFAG